MPVTIEVNPGLEVRSCYSPGHSKHVKDLLQECSPQDAENCIEIMHSSFTDDFARNQNVNGSANGLVQAIIEAYHEHRMVIIRPDDVWLAILTQFNHYVNANAEELRETIWSRKHQKTLSVHCDLPLGGYDWEHFPEKIVGMLGNYVNDDKLKEWILPDFSTTEAKDTAACSIAMMSTAQCYARYRWKGACGLAAVKLLGEKSDWENILARIEKLRDFGQQTQTFHELLDVVIAFIIDSFKDPHSADLKEKWKNLFIRTTEKDGVNFIWGFITAFCFWNDRGEQLHKHAPEEGELPPVEFDDLPSGFAVVPITIVVPTPNPNEAGHESKDNGGEYKAAIIGGSMATQGYIDHENASMGNTDNYSSMQPEVGWSVLACKQGVVSE